MIAMRSRAKRVAAIAADAMLGVLVPFLAGRGQNSELPASPRVLVIRCDHLGDAAMATAVLGPLRAALGPAALHVLASPWAAPVFDAHADVDRVITFAMPWWSAAKGASLWQRARQWALLPGLILRIRAARYDVGIDLRGDLRHIALFLALGGMRVRVSSDRTGGRRLLTHVGAHRDSLHEVEKNAAIASLLGATGPFSPSIAAGGALPEWLARLLGGRAFVRGYIAFALRGSASKRSWPAAHARDVADLLRARFGIGSVYVGLSGEEGFGPPPDGGEEPGIVNLGGRTTLAESIAVLRHARMTIAVDSGPMHLAAAVGSPVVALFGPSDPCVFGPWSDRVRFLGTGIPCGCVEQRCEFEAGGDCMRRILPDAVFAAVRELMDEQRSMHA